MFLEIESPFRISGILNYVPDRTFEADFSYDGEKHDFWEVVYVLSGKLEITEDEKVYLMGERDILFHAPNEFHRVRSAENTCPRVLNLSFRAEGSIPEELKNGVMNLSPDMHSEFVEITKMLREYVRSIKTHTTSSVSFFESTSRFSAFIMRLLRESRATDNISTSTGAKAYRAIVELMHEEVCSNLPLEEFAKKSFISVSYIKKLFSRYAGISPKSYYTNLRVQEAQKMLASDISVSDIAEKLNFSSASYFTLFFKNHTGVTPIQYRKNL